MMKKKVLFYLLLIVLPLFSLFYMATTTPNIDDRTNLEKGIIAQNPESSTSSYIRPFIYGTGYGPTNIDPLECCDKGTLDVLQQCLETLVSYDLSSHPHYELKPMLAESWAWENPKRISFKIRENVMFHDRTLLNADVVKWNFDRLMYFSNESGSVPLNATSRVAPTSSLYYLDNGSYLFNSFESDGAYNFTINLNGVFGMLLDLLTHASASILSPTFTPFYELLDLMSDKVIGTGPFVYDSYITNTEVQFHAFDYYWRVKPLYIDELVFKVIEDDTARMNAALAGQFDYVGKVTDTYLNLFRTATDMHVEDIGENLSYYYLEIYSGPRDYDGNMIIPSYYQVQRNNATLRRALAYALNYTFIVEEIHKGKAFYGIPAVPRVMPGHNMSVFHGYNESNYVAQIAKARDLMMAMYPTETTGLTNVLDGGVNDASWIAIAERPTPLVDFQLNEHSGGGLMTDLTLVCRSSWELIGINVNVTVRDWSEYQDVGRNTPWEMDGAFRVMTPDYLNPFNMIWRSFSLISEESFSRINQTLLMVEMGAAATEMDYAISLDKWKDVQSILYDVRFENPASLVHIPVYTYFMQQVHHDEVSGFMYNALDWVYFYPCKSERIIFDSFFLFSDAESPDLDGNFNLNWTPSPGAVSYSVYTSSAYIDYINGSQTVLAYQNANSPFYISGLTDGTYYFIIEAKKLSSFALSNCIRVDVLSSSAESPVAIPGLDVLLVGIVSIITGLVMVENVAKKRKNN
ncbi:MAG: ABC transporter substrate-binding protein [Candidatus Thorarchaeota archaeon]